MARQNVQKCRTDLAKGKTEEEIKNVYAKHFDIRYDTTEYIDLYTPQVLFEFKQDKNLENLRVRATILAQVLYYVRRLKFGQTEEQIPPILCLANHDGAILTETITWIDFYTDSSEKYDWDLTPSNPDTKLVNDLSNSPALKDIHIYKIQELTGYSEFADLLEKYLSAQYELNLIDKKIITESNVMYKNNLGEVSRKLFTQFLYRIKKEFENKTTILGLFSMLKYLNANNDQKFRDIIFQFQFEKGFIISLRIHPI